LEILPAVVFCQNKTFTTGGEAAWSLPTMRNMRGWPSFRDHGYDVKSRISLLELEQKLPYIHDVVGWNYRMTEMQSAIGLAELARLENWNMPNRTRNAHLIIDKNKDLPQVLYCPVDTEERRNGWYVLHFHWTWKI